MYNSHEIIGWKIHHQEQLHFRAKSGSPIIRLKIHNYPNYRQTVHIDKYPSKCRVKVKGNNSFLLFQHKVHSKGTISFDRTLTIVPNTSQIRFNDNWGKISDIPISLKKKYRESSKYWPSKSSIIVNTSKHDWFDSDDLFLWINSVYQYIRLKIKYPENQEERLGAHKAFLSGRGDCDEFTDLLITLARMRGIPCRRITGYFNRNKGISVENHAWGEIFSPEMGWITIDVALNNLGNHSINYVVLKVEEFNPELPNYQVQIKHIVNVHYEWDKLEPSITPIFRI